MLIMCNTVMYLYMANHEFVKGNLDTVSQAEPHFFHGKLSSCTQS